MSKPPFPPYPPYPPYPPHPSPPPYAPYAPYPAPQLPGSDGGTSGSPISSLGNPLSPNQPVVGQPPVKTTTTPPPPGQAPWPAALSIFFDYGRYAFVDSTAEGIGQNQNAKAAKFVADATAANVSQIVVTGFASPEDNLTTTLPTNRAQRLKDKLDELFAAGTVRPSITVGPTGVLTGDQSTWPSLRRADASVVG